MKKKLSKLEFSKRLMIVLTAYNIIMTIWAFVLYSVGREVPSEIVVALISGLFGEVTGYFTKAYLGKRNEEANKIEREKYDGYDDNL